jgi:hypothetical protein
VSGEVIARPAEHHHCGVNDYGVWSEVRDSTDPDSPFRQYYASIHQHDPPGTTRACSECGRVWVAYRHPPDSGRVTTFWRRETWFERWRRNRRARR